MSAEAVELLNSLGIAGPNIRHAIEDRSDPKRTDEDRALDAVLDVTEPGAEWCVCGRRWPCDAERLAALLADTPSVEPAGLDEAEKDAEFVHVALRNSHAFMEACPFCVAADVRANRMLDKAHDRIAACLLPTQASDSPEKT